MSETKREKLFIQIKQNPKNVRFDDLKKLSTKRNYKMAEKLKDFEYYMSLNYPIKYWNDDDGFFIEIPDLPGCMTFCEEFGQINEMAEDAKKSWISSRLEKGLEIPEPRNEEDFSGKILLRLAKSLHRTLSNQAKREGVSLNQHILGLLSGKSSIAEVENRVIGRIEEMSNPQHLSLGNAPP